MTNDTQKALRRRAGKLCIGLDKSVRYHQRRAGFLGSVHRTLMFVILVLNGGLLTSFALAASPTSDAIGEATLQLVAFAGAGAGVLAALDLVFRFSGRSSEHAILAREFTRILCDLNAAMISTPGAVSRELLSSVEARRRLAEDREEDIYWALEALCLNETLRSYGSRAESGDMVRVPWHARLLRHILSFEPNDFQRCEPAPATT